MNIKEEFARHAERFMKYFQKRDFLADKAKFLEDEVAKKSLRYTEAQLADIRKKRFISADEIRVLRTAEEKIRLEANKKFSELKWRALKMEKGHYRW